MHNNFFLKTILFLNLVAPIFANYDLELNGDNLFEHGQYPEACVAYASARDSFSSDQDVFRCCKKYAESYYNAVLDHMSSNSRDLSLQDSLDLIRSFHAAGNHFLLINDKKNARKCYKKAANLGLSAFNDLEQSASLGKTCYLILHVRMCGLFEKAGIKIESSRNFKDVVELKVEEDLCLRIADENVSPEVKSFVNDLNSKIEDLEKLYNRLSNPSLSNVNSCISFLNA